MQVPTGLKPDSSKERTMEKPENRKFMPTELGMGTRIIQVPVPTLLSSRCFHGGQGSRQPRKRKRDLTSMTLPPEN